MPEEEPRPWWQDGVLGRIDAFPSSDVFDTLRLARDPDEGLGLDALILRPPSTEVESTFAPARELGLRLLIDLGGVAGDQTPEAFEAAARSWLDRGADGIAVDVEGRIPAAPTRVTRMFGAPVDEAAESPEIPEVVRSIVDRYPDRILLARRVAGTPGPSPREPHLVVETLLDRLPWRGAGLGDAIEAAEAELAPRGGWPGWAMGAPRRGPFAVGLPMDDALACAASLHLTLRGTPCIELGEETGLPQNPSRRDWFRRLLGLRRREVALRRGGWRRLVQEKAILGYLREHEAERLAVVLNPGRRTRTGNLPTGSGWTVLLATDFEEGHRLAGGPVRLSGNGVLIARAGPPQSRALGGGGRRRATGR